MPSDDLSTTVSWPDRHEDTDPGPLPATDDPLPAEVLDDAPGRGSGDAGRAGAVYGGSMATVGGAGAGRFLLEAHDRFAERVLERLRSLREDTDTDLGAVRSELAALRHAMEDLADRVQLRKLWTELDEVRTELAGLRVAVLEWPELDRLHEKVDLLAGAVRHPLVEPGPMPHELVALGDLGERWESDLAALREAVAAQADAVEALARGGVRVSAQQRNEDLERIAELVRVPAGRPELTALGPILEELAAMRAELAPLGALRDEVEALRRRIALRAQPSTGSLGADDLGRLADAVTERLLAELRPPGRRP